MTNLIINENKRTIEMTKGFSKAARIFGSDEYKMLQEAKRDYPAFRVITKNTSKNDSFRGLTFEYMRKYIILHPLAIELAEEIENEDGKPETVTIEKSAIDVFCELVALDIDGNSISDSRSANYAKVKAWFLNLYPEVKNMRAHQKALLSSKVKKVA